MAIIKSFSSFQNLSNFSTFIVDRNPNSDFFRITEFKEAFSGGKNGFLIEGSEFLKETTEVKIEILDVEGNPVYYEPGKGTPDYYEGLSTLVSVHVYPDTPIGIGKITVLGELKEYINENGTRLPVPDEWKGVYNVKWERTFKINRNIANEDTVRFYRRPTISITELVKPIFSKTIPSVTQTGSLEGLALQPSANSSLSNWTAGTLYKLKITDDSNWSSSVDENTISIPSLGYSPVVREVLNNKEVLVDVPYSVNNIVQNFSPLPYQTTFEFLEGQVVNESALTGSFARIRISNLKTFVGDVARVKVFRKSRNEVTDFQFVQESKLEASELLRDITVSNDTEISYGNFSEFNLSTYWVSSSNDHPLSINVDVLQSSVKTDYNFSAGGIQQLITSESFSITKDVEYTLTLKTLISGSLNGSEYLRGYLSSSDGYQQTFLTVSGSDIFKTRQIVSQNIIANPISASDAKLVFDISGSDWYISNVSLKNAQETSFSPDEFILIQEIPRKLASETFDFRFEFYDINNNYIPVDVTAVGTFDGGNDFPTSGKLLNFESDRNAFRFSTGSLGNPPFQQVQFKTTTQNLVGEVTYASAAFDVDGNYINPNLYSGDYPGGLTNVTSAGALLTIANFSGSDTSVTVGSIVYTASLEGLEEFETVFRLEDGENAPQLIVTSNANQFVYEPTRLAPKPEGQSITIRAHRKNLASLSNPIIVNKSNVNAPDLVDVIGGDINGIKTYTISALQFSSSFAANNFDEVTYQFTSSDIFGNEQSDEITLSKVINFDGVSVVLSTENTSFNADSTGTVTSAEFDKGDGTVDVRIGSNVISHSEGLVTKNTFDIVSVTPSTGLTANSTLPTTNSYGIDAMSVDSGTLTLLIQYKAGDNLTTVDFTKIVNYSKAKKAAPILNFVIGNNNQNATAKSTGAQIDSFVNATLNVVESYNGVSTNRTLVSAPTINSSSPYTLGTVTTTSVGLPNLPLGTDSLELSVTGSVVDSESVTRQVFGNISLSKSKNAVPSVVISATPQAQSVLANSSGVQTGTLSNVTVSALEGTTPRFTSMSVASVEGINVSTGTSNISDQTLILSDRTMSAAEASITLTVTHTDSEDTSGQTKTIVVRTTRVNVGTDGADGADGAPGADGADGADGAPGAVGGDGPGIVFRGPWSPSITYNSVSQDATRRDAVLYNGVYYATLPNTTANLNRQPDTQTAFWESLGTNSFFVAAEIIISKESFVQNTINVGTNPSGNANITIAGGTTSPFISIGQATKAYGNNGVFIGSNGSGGIMSLVGSGGGLFWDGTNLTVNGSGNFTGTVTGGTIVGGTINVPNATSPLFTVNAAGELTATSATIGGWSVNTGGIFRTQSGSTIRLNSTDNKIQMLEGTTTGIPRFDVSTENTIPIVPSATFVDGPRGVFISRAGFAVGRDNQRYFRNVTIGETPIGGKSFVFNDTKGGFRTDILTFHTPVLSDNFFKFPIDSGRSGLDNDSLLPYALSGGVPNASFPVWMPRTSEVIMYDRPGDPVGGYLPGSQPYNSGELQKGGGTAIGGTTFRVHTGTPETDSTFGGVTLPLRFRIDATGNIQILKDLQVYGNITAFFTSDKRLKENIIPISNSLQKVNKLNGVEFDWKKGFEDIHTLNGHDIGLLAQEVEVVLPEIVSTRHDGYKAIQYEKVVALLVESVKELSNKVIELSNKVTELENKK